MKTLRQILEVKQPEVDQKPGTDGYEPKAGDEKKFKAKHVVVKSKLDQPSNDDKMFNATNVKTVNRPAEHHGYNAGQDVDVYEETENLDEVLKSSDPTSKWIHDFVRSKNPKFAGKSKKERIQMALGAKYAKMKESIELTDEEFELFEARKLEGVRSVYNTHLEDAHGLLQDIAAGLKQHKAVTSTAVHWGHVGDIKHVKRQLEDLRDMLHQQGEYAKPVLPVKMAEENQIVESKDMAVHVVSTSQKKDGQTAHKVVAVGSKVTGVKVGEHLSDSELDDLSELGHKVKMGKPLKAMR